MDTNLLRKTTEELTREVNFTPDIDEYFADNCQEFIKETLPGYLNKLLHKYNMTKSEVFKNAGMCDTNYGYEIFRGDKKNMSRDKLIQICMGFPLICDEAQKVLRLGGVGTLYPRIQRDACIMFALANGYNLYKLNELLYERGEKIIM